MRKILLALGGNALGDDPKEQEGLTRKTARVIVDLVEEGNEIIVTHGNGPQVGMINLGLEDYEIPLAECIAMSQGYIGYHLAKSIREELEARKIDKKVTSLVTQVLVDREDEAFKTPTKPIGRFYKEEEIKSLGDRFVIKNDSNRGYRRYVASPKPLEVLEDELIGKLLSSGTIVIAAGGGGVPVVKDGTSYIGVDGVIDKDLTSALLADRLDVDKLVILTQVDKVFINFGREDEKSLDRVTTDDLRLYIKNGEFGEGSMLPKIEASINFVESKEARESIISSIDKVSMALRGEDGTIIG